MNKFGAILWAEWQPLKEDKIVGFYAEDNGKYEIVVPKEIRDMLINLQNMLHRFYVRIDQTEKELATLKEQSAIFFGKEI